MFEQEKNGLDQATSAAHTVRSAIKTGKAVSAAAKGAAVGGPYGAAAGLTLAAGQHGKKLLAAVAVVLLLPILFVLMLPGLIFGGLTSSGTPSQPVLNDSDAITGNMDSIAAAIDEILAEGVADAQARAAQDFASTGGDNYEIVQPFTVSSNTNSFIGQYCAAKEESWAEISLEDLKRLLRTGKSHLYSFTRTNETRMVAADDPDTPDVVEVKHETWYIYTLVYNGESYFAGQVFHLTDDQKELAGDYAQNLSLFLSDGSIQYTEYSGGKLVVAIMSPGHFTTGGHFIVLRGVKDGKILVADPASTSRSQKAWDLSIILNEASKRPGAGGPFWLIGL